MRRRIAIAVLAAAMTIVAPLASRAASAGDCPVDQISAGLDELGRTGHMPPEIGKLISDPKVQRVPTFKPFDNVAYVGVCWVSSWLIVDPAGDILIDTLHEPHVDTLVANLAAAGAKLGDIRYVLITHGHFDHAGGAAHLKPLLPNARFVMTRAGWDEAIRSANSGSPPHWAMIAPDIVAKDGDQLTVGKTTVTVYETPGHTFGTASFVYDVTDGGKTYRAVTIGGLGLNDIKNVAQVEAYVASIKRLQAMAGDPANPITVSLTTHPPAAGMFGQADALASRKPGEPNPFVDPAALKAQLAQLLQSGEERLQVERKKAAGAQ